MARLVAALIRHGDYRQMVGAPSAHQPFPLNEAGRAHAVSGADMLRRQASREGWELLPVVDSSRMLRAWQTAQILIDGLADLFASKPRVESFDDLAERGLGCAANLTLSQIDRVLDEDPRFDRPPPNWKADSRYQLPLQGAESLLQAGARVAEHIERRMSTLPGPRDRDGLKLFVGHGAAFRHAAFHLGLLTLEEVAGFSMFHGRPVFVERSETGAWRHVGGEWKVRAAGAGTED